jgi:hypothetical protein
MARGSPTGGLIRLTLAQTAGQAGTWAGYVAALPAALAQPHPAVALGAITAAWGFPSAAARLAGGMVDRFGPRVIGASAWGLAAVAADVPAVTHPTLPALLVVLALLSVGGTWGVSAGEAAPTWLPGCPDLAAAGSWLVIATSLPLAIGPVGASNLVTYAGDQAAWGMVAMLSAVAALTSLLVPAVAPETIAPAESPTLNYLNSPTAPGATRRRSPLTPQVWAVLSITAGVYLTFGVITILEPLYVRQVLHGPFTTYGWLLAVYGIAGIVTSATVGGRSSIITAPLATPVAALLVAFGETVYVTTPFTDVAFAGAALFGVGAALFRLSARAVIVHTVPPREHGRALSLWESVQCTFFVIPAVFTGTLVTRIGVRLVFACCCTASGAIAGASARIWQAVMDRPGPSWQTRPAQRPAAQQRPAQQRPERPGPSWQTRSPSQQRPTRQPGSAGQQRPAWPPPTLNEQRPGSQPWPARRPRSAWPPPTGWSPQSGWQSAAGGEAARGRTSEGYGKQQDHGDGRDLGDSHGQSRDRSH